VSRYYAKDVSPETEKEAFEFQKLLATWAGRPFLQDFVPGLRPLMSLISSNERKMAKRTDAFFDTILREHRQRPNAVESSQDFVDVLIQSVGEDGKRLDDSAIKAVTMVSHKPGSRKSNPHHMYSFKTQLEIDTQCQNSRVEIP
jgi:DNA-binding GntR family transcriptional regulator